MTKSIEDDMFGIAKIVSLMPKEDIENKVKEIAEELSLRVTLIDPIGRVISDSQTDAKQMDNHMNRPEIQQAKTEGRGKATRFSTTIQESMLYIALPIKDNTNIKGYIRLARPLVEVRQSLDYLYQSIYLTLYIIAIPSLLLALLFSRIIASRLSNN
jgi:two-component system phosphate regulon sensor histidine kinase PhoR